jgi:ABC-type glutathione transport system ATPase component
LVAAPRIRQLRVFAIISRPVSSTGAISRARLHYSTSCANFRELGIAILFITHDLRVAAQICDCIAVMQTGKIVELGPTRTVLSAPSPPYSRELLEPAPGRGFV